MNYVNLSKEISYALRHAPWEYELELDTEGYVPLHQLLSALNENDRFGRAVTADDVQHIMDTSDKKRFEISDGRIRALYGHSVPMHISKTPITPPDILYHGTTHRARSAILQDGLRPMARQYVHLSVDTATAVQVGSRRESAPVILKIDAAKAFQDGIVFYEGNEKVVLADFVPAQYITVQKG